MSNEDFNFRGAQLLCKKFAKILVVDHPRGVTSAALERLLTELEDFLNILDKENLSSTAILKKCLLSEILQMCLKNNSSGDEEYIYMNKVLAPHTDTAEKPDSADTSDLPTKNALTNGVTALHTAPPQKSLPDLPPPKIIPEKTQSPKAETVEGYYEEAEPYDASVIGTMFLRSRFITGV
ncbi:actin filament-associated protein 1-like 2 [Rhinoderma darwinii]|uniref:actin filament-associated protein 1-like 2 n=1 Tax=Rhinoderma darwinii TaxID=43563 RepID=UPI003F6704D0